MLFIVQSVRAMLYLAAEGYTWSQIHRKGTLSYHDNETMKNLTDKTSVTSMEEKAYDQLVNAATINCRNSVDNDIVADLQSVLCAQGWCTLCVDIISRKRLKWLYLPAIRLLNGIVGGGNVLVQNRMLTDLTNPTLNPFEIFAKNFRRLLRAGPCSQRT